MKLSVWKADDQIADLDIVAKLEIAAFLGKASDGPAVPQRRYIPQVLTGAAIQLALVHSHLLPVQPDRAGLQNA